MKDLTTPLNTVGLDVAPAILMPFYDEDSSTLFVTGKVGFFWSDAKGSLFYDLHSSQGDSTIYAFEITDEAPHICPLSHHRCSTLHQGLSFLTKNHCDVTAVEFAKALRLTNNTVEPLSFTVPRIKVLSIAYCPLVNINLHFYSIERIVPRRLVPSHSCYMDWNNEQWRMV